MTPRILEGDNLALMRAMDDGLFDLVYMDPPFNTGRARRYARQTMRRDANGAHKGFQGRRYAVARGPERAYADAYDDYLGFLEPRLREARRLLKDEGSLFLHVDPRESHYCKVALDGLFGRASFMNEIIWAYDYGGRAKRRWSAKHDVLFWYAKNPKRYVFRHEAIDRVPYMAPALVGPEKAARGKTPTDVWWNTIVPTNGAERTGYPTQKPLAILKRIIAVHTEPGAHVLDCFAGSGTTGAAAQALGRRATLIDANPEAIATMKRRLAPTRIDDGCLTSSLRR